MTKNRISWLAGAILSISLFAVSAAVKFQANMNDFVTQSEGPEVIRDSNRLFEFQNSTELQMLLDSFREFGSYLQPRETMTDDNGVSMQLEASEPVKDSELHCLALNIYFEARGEQELGQRAVGHVVVNRVASGRFPSTICGVVHQGGQRKRYRCQFSWWCDGRADIPRDEKSWARAVAIATDVYEKRCVDPTGGALWYHAEYVRPGWKKAFVKSAKIGQHIFYMAA